MMDDLRERFATLDRVPVPDLWDEVANRLEALGTVRPTPRLVAVRTERRRTPNVGTRRRAALLLAAALLAVALVAGALAAGGALLRQQAVAPSLDLRTAPLPTSTGPVATTSTQPDATSAPVRAAAWRAAGSMSASRLSHTATLLNDGKVLVVGGCVSCDPRPAPQRQQGSPLPGTTDLYDPATSTWSTTGRLATERRLHTASLLHDGTVLVAGGTVLDAGPPGPLGLSVADTARSLDSVELYNPGTGTWSVGRAMITPRFRHTATVLTDGRVLVVGGVDARADSAGDASFGGRALDSAELYDPSTRTWTATGAMTRPREGHTAILLADGRVLVFAGATTGRRRISNAELYDPTTGTWTPTGAMVTSTSDRPGVRLRDGRVLVEGGEDGQRSFATAELFDPTTGTWTSTGSMAVPRSRHTATLLPDGSVLVAGGNDFGRASAPAEETVASAELYDPVSGTWTAAPAMAARRAGQTAVLLFDGTVLVAGGEQLVPHRWPTAAELYVPASGNR
jgi:hypothetical protein